MVIVAPELSFASAGKYGIGLPMTRRGAALGPLRLTMRPSIFPLTPVSTGVLTHSLLLGVTGVGKLAFVGTAVAPALSPCQPLDTPMSPCMRRSLEMVMRPPRLGTSCHINPLDWLRFTGLT